MGAGYPASTTMSPQDPTPTVCLKLSQEEGLILQRFLEEHDTRSAHPILKDISTRLKELGCLQPEEPRDSGRDRRDRGRLVSFESRCGDEIEGVEQGEW